MDQCPLNITVSEARQLHNQIVNDYRPWIAEAPPSYTEGGFFTDSVPLAIISCCGQNQQIFSESRKPETQQLYDEEVEAWNRRHDFSQVKYVSLAIASHMS